MQGPRISDRPLAGRRILLTRPRGRGASLVERLESLGADVEWRPTIAFEPPDASEPIRMALAGLAGYDWLLFTSANGVRHFDRALPSSGRDWGAVSGQIAAVGPATAEALRRAGLEPAVVAPSSRAEGLAEALGGQVGPGQRVLLVRPEVARTVLADSLSAAGASVDSVAFYRTVPAPGIGEITVEIEGGSFDAIVLTSPSTLQTLLDTAGSTRQPLLDALARASLIAIGDVTAGAIERASLPVAAVAGTPTDDELVRAVISAIGAREPLDRG